MKLGHALTTLSFALCFADTVVARHAISRQQSADIIVAPTIINKRASSDGSPSSTAQSNAASTTVQPPSSTAENSHKTGLPATPTKSDETVTFATHAPTKGPLTNSTTVNGNSTVTKHAQLPIEPKITPALGLAGVILMAAGIALTLIGIKHNWLHIFLSTSLLASLAVTVLIVYLMHPPVSDGIQGAFFVAALISGLLFGGVSLIFKDITETLGCLLGGFCVAMWFLVLAPGGLVKSATGRAIMIAVFCVVGWSFAFSHYTRNYGLIICTSFAGAMVTIVGIDCFSGAGLKEFWLYLWNLNSEEFPIGTTTYPITRGIRVEIAGTIVLFFFGVMSQVKIWKIVKERRQKVAEAQMRDVENRDQHDSAVGAKIEANNERDLAQWEATYGEKRAAKVTDSALGSSVESFQKHSTTITEREVDGIELADMQPGHSRRDSKQDRRRISQGPSGSKLPPKTANSQTNLMESDEFGTTFQSHSASASTSASPAASQRGSSDMVEGALTTKIKETPEEPLVPPAPQVVPLPFSPPIEQEDDARSDDGSIGSRVTAGQSAQDSETLPLNRLALKKHDQQTRQSVRRIEDDRASSVAATADDDVDLDNVSQHILPSHTIRHEADSKRSTLLTVIENDRERSPSPSGRSAVEKPVEENDEEELVRPPTVTESVKRELARSTRKQGDSIASSRKKSAGSSGSKIDEKSENADGEVSVAGSLSEHLPAKLSKVAMAYRTNEWAKHVTDADQPAEEEGLPDRHSPGIQVDLAFAEEAAKPVDMGDLSGATACIPEPVEVTRNTSKSGTNPFRQSKEAPPLTRRASASATPVYAFQRSSSQMSMAGALQRQSSSSSMAQPPKLQTRLSARQSSAALVSQTLMESPTEETFENAAPPRVTSTPLGMTRASSGSNLLDQRNDRLKSKPTTVSFNALTSTHNLNPIAPSDSASVRDLRVDDFGEGVNASTDRFQHLQALSDEDMTLAERKAIVQQQQRAQTTSPPGPMDPAMPRRKNSFPLPGTSIFPSPAGPGNLARMSSVPTMPNSQAVIYDSHQPKRGASVDRVRQANMLTQWRQSIAQEGATRAPAVAEQSARDSMMSQRQWNAWQRQQAEQERANRESVMDMAMRSGQMQSAHQDVLRRMQAKANEKARE